MASLGFAASTNASVTSTVDSSTPWMAASEGNLELLQSSLVALNLPTTVADENGYTLLHAASSYSQLTVLQFLLSHCDKESLDSRELVDACDSEGDSALHYAGNATVLRFLVEVGKLDPTKANKQGKTALQTKTDELNEMLQDEDIEQDDEDLEIAKEMVEYLSSVTFQQ
jgi:ankyrin repeat protein